MTALSKARLAALQNLMARLKAKRFRQIFEYLDQDQDGLLDLAELLSGRLAALTRLLCMTAMCQYTSC